MTSKSIWAENKVSKKVITTANKYIFRYNEWDNRFFGISDKEAEMVDPQQHFVLESVHMALEDAGIPKEKIAGSNTGVYIGTKCIC